MPRVPDVHLQLEIAELLVSGIMSDAVAVEHAVERLKHRLAVRDMPLGKVLRGP